MLPGVGIFGTEPAARILVPILREFGFTIEALWGRIASETEDLARELKIDNYTTKIDDVLLRKNVDLVFVVCPPYLHSQISVKALGIGKHVIVCSGNMGLGQSDALKMQRASLYYPSLIALTSSLRFLPAATQMRKLINEQNYLGDRGAVLLEFRLQMGTLFQDKYDWLCDSTMGGGILNLFGSHLIDLVTFLTQQKAMRVNGVVRTYTETTQAIQGIRRVTAPDFCNFQMELTNGALVTVTLHSHQCINGSQATTSFFSQDLMVCGKDGSYLALRGNDLYGQRGATNGKEEVLFVDDSPYGAAEQLLPRPHVKGLFKMVAALREAFLPVQQQTGWIKSPVESAATFDDGMYVQAVLDAIRRSNEERSWVPVSIISESPTNPTKIMHAVRMSAAVAAD